MKQGLTQIAVSLVATATGLFALSSPNVQAEPSEVSSRSGRTGVSGNGAETPDFQTVCRYSHSAPNDPIVHPGHAGASHLHDFFANVSTDADSDYDSLRSAETTCERKGDTAAYWLPAFYDSGKRAQSPYANTYYTAGTKDYKTVRSFPPGLKMVTRKGISACQNGPGPAREFAKGFPTCAPGDHLILVLQFPDCWDGKNLDSGDHESHMAFANTTCPASHPVPMPSVAFSVIYKSDGGDIEMGSPDMPVAPHADFFNAWDQQVLENLVVTCLNAGKRCGRSPEA